MGLQISRDDRALAHRPEITRHRGIDSSRQMKSSPQLPPSRDTSKASSAAGMTATINTAPSQSSSLLSSLAPSLALGSEKRSFVQALGDFLSLTAAQVDPRSGESTVAGALGAAKDFGGEAELLVRLLQLQRGARPEKLEPNIIDILRVLAQAERSGADPLRATGAYAESYMIEQLKRSAVAEFNELFSTSITRLSPDSVAGSLLQGAGAETVADLLGFPVEKSGAGGRITSGEALAAEASVGKAALASSTTTFSKLLGALGAGYSLYELVTNWGKGEPISGLANGAAVGAYLGSTFLPGAGTLVGGVLGGLVGLASGIFKNSGKPPEQKERDAIRGLLQKGGFLNREWGVALADGSTFDLGKDGGFRLQNINGGERSMIELDSSNPLAARTAQLLAPLARALCGGNGRLEREWVALLTNAATSNVPSIEGASKNVQAMYAQFERAFAQ